MIRAASHRLLLHPLILSWGFLCASPVVSANEELPSQAAFDKIWSHATLWKSPESDSSLALSGRLQADAYWFNADKQDVSPGVDDDASDTLWRRFRFGFKSKFGDGYTVQLEADLDLNNEFDDMYNRLTDAYIGYSPGETWGVKLLKQSVGYSLDGATSSKDLLTLQRNNLTNNLWASDEYFSGAQVSGTIDGTWRYRAGLFSGDNSEEIGFDRVGYFSLLSLGYDFSQALDITNAMVRVDYVYNDKDNDDRLDDSDNYHKNGTPDLSHTTSLVTEWQSGAWGLRTDVSAGQGLDQQSNLWGLVAMPFYSFDRHQQVVLRYTYINSTDDNGLRLGRYENAIVSGQGNRYQEVYLGYNLFIYGQKLKWQTGLQYANMEDAAEDGGEYKGWGLTTGLRMYW